MKFRTLAFLLAAAAGPPDTPTGPPNRSRVSAQRALPAKMNKVAGRHGSLGAWDNHSMSLVHREASGEAELHETQSDILFITGGDGSIVVGGTIPNGRTYHPARNPRTRNRRRRETTPPPRQMFFTSRPKPPHQMILEPGQTLNTTLNMHGGTGLTTIAVARFRTLAR